MPTKHIGVFLIDENAAITISKSKKDKKQRKTSTSSAIGYFITMFIILSFTIVMIVLPIVKLYQGEKDALPVAIFFWLFFAYPLVVVSLNLLFPGWKLKVDPFQKTIQLQKYTYRIFWWTKPKTYAFTDIQQVAVRNFYTPRAGLLLEIYIQLNNEKWKRLVFLRSGYINYAKYKQMLAYQKAKKKGENQNVEPIINKKYYDDFIEVGEYLAQKIGCSFIDEGEYPYVY